MLVRRFRFLQNFNAVRARHLNSLHNPMFPQRNLPEVEEAPKQKKETPDFIDEHGGKILLTVISTIGFLIYRWVKGGNNKLKVEDAIADQSPLHPYESFQFRQANSLTGEDFSKLLQTSRQKFSDGFISYDEFILLVQENIPKKISMAYLFDRVILAYLESINQTTSSKIPISIFFITLSNTLQLPPQDRSELLFDLAQTITPSEIQFFFKSTSDENLLTPETNTDSALYCTINQVKSFVNLLDIGYQIPYEKRVIESGVNWPFPEYRRKTPEEIVNDGLAKMKPPPHKGGYLSRDEFSEFILGSAVCAWGECYRK